MKRILILPILLLLAAAGLVVYSFALPSVCVVEQSTVLSAPPERVFTYLNNPTQWEAWSVWSKQYDPYIVHMYGGPLAGAGARHSWISDKSGNGMRVFTESTQPYMLAYEQKTTGEFVTTKGEILLEKVTAGTRMVWRQTTSFDDTILGRYKGAWRKYKTDKELQQGLAGLEALLQQIHQKRAAR